MNKIGYPAKGSKREAEWIWNNHKNEFKPRKQSSISLLQWCIENWDENGERVYQEWDRDSNEVKIWEVTSGSHTKVKWKCEKGHVRETTVNKRTSRNGCPYCSNQKIILGYNDFLTMNPELASEWNQEKNDLLPSEVTSGSNKKVWWKCKKGHEWEATISARSSGNGCPFCSNKKVSAGYNDLLTLNPKVASEWNYEKNDILPSEVTCGSHKKVWWKCKVGHEWEATVKSRNNGRGCPYCKNKRVLMGDNDLSTMNSNLVLEWNYERNDILPSEVTSGSNKKVWWKCEKGHEWKATVNYRNTGGGCPYCSNKRVTLGENDLLTMNPELASEWNYEKNEILPSEVTCGSHKKVWWKCKVGHEWEATVKSRNNGRGCPRCNHQTSFPEQAVYYYIKNIFSDAVNSYRPEFMKHGEIDVYIPAIQVGIEYDGAKWHGENRKNVDESKGKLIIENGIRLIRVREPECCSISDDSIIITTGKRDSNYLYLDAAIESLMNTLNVRKECIDINVFRDRLNISEQFKSLELKKSIANQVPELVPEWNYKKNGSLRPENFRCKSHIKVWWKCEKGHEWEDTIAHRSCGRGCPYCSNKRVLVGYNDLVTVNPELASEWNYTKNSLKPYEVTVGSNKKVWWKCEKGHEWEAVIDSRNCEYGLVTPMQMIGV